MLDICLLGTGGMMPLPNRWLTSMMARCNGSSLMIDCGEGTQVALRKKGWSPKSIDTICFTHYHADHISGLPGLLLTMGNAQREEPVTMIGPQGLEKVVNALRIIAPELPFPIKFIELSKTQVSLTQSPYSIEAFQADHRIPCYGYSVFISRAGRFDPEKAKQQGIPQYLWSRLQKGEIIESEGRCYTPDMVLGNARKGLKVTYCTDTRPIPRIAENAKNADLFICEGMHGDDDKDRNLLQYKHMGIFEAAKLASAANVKELWLTHYSPALLDPDDYLEKAQNLFRDTIASRDGQTKELRFEED